MAEVARARHVLTRRITLTTLLIFLVSIWTLSFYASRMLREDMERLLADQESSTVSYVAAELDHALQERILALEEVARSINQEILNDPAVLQQLLEQRPHFRSMFNSGVIVVSRDGTAIADTPVVSGRKGTNYASNAATHTALTEGRSVIGRPLIGRVLQQPVFNINVPIPDASGNVIGALFGVINLSEPNFLDRVGEHQYGKSGGYLVMDLENNLIVTATDKSRVLQPLPTSGTADTIDRRRQGFLGSTVSVNSLGVEVLSSASRIPTSGWLVVATLPTEEAFAPIRALQQRMLLATIFLTVLAGAITWWTLRHQLAPLLATVETLAKLAHANEYPQPLPITRQDEIGELIGGFNRLLGNMKSREDAVRESEIRFRTMVEWTPEPLLVHRDGKILYANPAAIKMFGATSAQELVGKPVLDLVHRDFHQIVLSRVKNIVDHGGGVPMIEMLFLKLDGTEMDVEVQGTSIDFDGAPAVHVAVRDITARKQAEQALRLLASVFEHAHEAITITDNKANILAVNPRFSEITGYAPEEVVGKNPRLLQSGRQSVDFYRSMWASLQSTGFWSGEIWNKRKDGTVYPEWLDISAVRNDAGEVVNYFAVFTDITVRVSLEAQLRESQKMEAIGTLAGGIAHDFNNILATILGNAELARADASTNPLALQSLEEIRKAGTRARDLVQQILSFSRRQPTERKPVLLAPIVEESARLLRATLPSGLTLEVHCDADLPSILADATQIEQVLINLATNAMQAMQGGAGRIRILLDTVLLDAELAATHPRLRAMHERHPGRAIRLSVSDDGSGMDADVLDKIFEPFFTTKAANEGTGLGLAVVHGIVQAHEGAIEVESQPGNGTTFTLYFPAAEARADAPESYQGEAVPDAAPMPGSGQHILYIDDDDSLVFLVRRLLERSGYRVSAYVGPREALDALRADPAGFALVVTDYNMPGMSGLDVAREVRAIRADLPVAVASGFIDETLHAHAAQAGVRDLIFKPTVVEDFCAAVQRLVPRTGKESGTFQ